MHERKRHSSLLDVIVSPGMAAAPCAMREGISHTAGMAESKSRKHLDP